MYLCSFELNNQPMSSFKLGSRSYPAFSGLGSHVNQRSSACMASAGPIPPGEYYIFDRQSGGLFGALKDLFSERSEWFALYAIDGKIDDETFCDHVKRGNFRLHPKGRLGISLGCVTIESHKDFQAIRTTLKGTSRVKVPGIDLEAYGKLTVK